MCFVHCDFAVAQAITIPLLCSIFSITDYDFFFFENVYIGERERESKERKALSIYEVGRASINGCLISSTRTAIQFAAFNC